MNYNTNNHSAFKFSGENKNYGLVEYKTDHEQARDIVNKLDGQEVGGARVHCDFIKPSLASRYSNLHSRCLLVNNLPKTFSDFSQFREIFSKHVSPIYCQVCNVNVIPYSDQLGDVATILYNNLYLFNSIASQMENINYTSSCNKKEQSVGYINTV